MVKPYKNKSVKDLTGKPLRRRTPSAEANTPQLQSEKSVSD
jgi:hypothetical protein